MRKKLKALFTNWRNYVIVLCGIASMLSLLCECTNLYGLLFTKVAGVVLYIVTALLFIHWKDKGKINELSELLNM